MLGTLTGRYGWYVEGWASWVVQLLRLAQVSEQPRSQLGQMSWAVQITCTATSAASSPVHGERLIHVWHDSRPILLSCIMPMYHHPIPQIHVLSTYCLSLASPARIPSVTFKRILKKWQIIFRLRDFTTSGTLQTQICCFHTVALCLRTITPYHRFTFCVCIVFP